MMEHEQAFVRAFIVADKQARYLAKLSSSSRRRDITARLYHSFDYDPKYVAQIPPGEQTTQAIFARLRKLGAPESCHAIAADSKLDGEDLPLAEALERVVGVIDGVILSCIPGVLAYYESEDLKGRYVLSRPVLEHARGR
jgi:hypothetical protein